MSFQHLQLSEPVFGLFLSDAQHGAFLQTHEGKCWDKQADRAEGVESCAEYQRLSFCFHSSFKLARWFRSLGSERLNYYNKQLLLLLIIFSINRLELWLEKKTSFCVFVLKCPKIFSSLSQRKKETRKYSQLTSCNQRSLTYFLFSINWNQLWKYLGIHLIIDN